jgi:hypothetical protein
MISIKRFLENQLGGSTEDHDLLPASLQMARNLLDAIATSAIRGRDEDFRSFSRTMRALSSRMDEPPSPFWPTAGGERGRGNAGRV